MVAGLFLLLAAATWLAWRGNRTGAIAAAMVAIAGGLAMLIYHATDRLRTVL